MRVIAIMAGLFFVFTAARVSAAEPIASIPYRIDYNGWYTIDVTVNDKGPYNFIVDTGATLTAVFENIAETQQFTLTGGEPRRVLGVTGSQSLPATFIGDISIGGLHMNDHIGVVIADWDTDEAKPHGILGLDFLSQYIVHFNAQKKQIEFFHPDAPPEAVMDEMTSVRMPRSSFNHQQSSLYTITVLISGRRIPCIFDLGAAGTLINYRAMRRLLGGIYIDAPRATGVNTGSKIQDVFGDEDAARAYRASSVKIGRASWGRQTLVVYNAGIFQELGVHRKSFGLLGADLFRDRSFVIDFHDERFYVSRQPVTDAS